MHLFLPHTRTARETPLPASTYRCRSKRSALETRRRCTVRSALLFAVWLPVSVTFADTTDTDIHQGWLKHAARAQLYRWSQIHEHRTGGIDNALDTLSADVFVKTKDNTSRGRQAYAGHIESLPDDRQTASIVNASQVSVLDDQSLAMAAEITRLDADLRQTGIVRSSTLSFQSRLERDESILPIFNQIEIGPAAQREASTFEDTYAQNRLLSLVHYFLAGIEHPDHDPEPLGELLARSFRLDLSSGSVTSYPAFAAWLRGPASQVVAGTHKFDGFTFDTLAEDERYVLSMEVDWLGLRADGTRLSGKTRQIWTVTNETTDRFARIESIDEEVLEPVAPVAN